MVSDATLFRLRPDDSSSPRYQLDASHRWHLPGVRCSSCGAQWGQVGLAYAGISLTGTSLDSRLRDPQPENDHVLEDLRTEVRKLAPEGALPFLPPGTGLGPLDGKATGSCPVLGWVGAWYLACASETATSLGGHSLRLTPAAPTAVKAPWPEWVNSVELTAPPIDCLSERSYREPPTKPCGVCGRRSGRLGAIVVRGRAVPTGLDLFRAYPESTVILGTARFKGAADKIGLTGIAWEPVAID